MSSQSHSKSVQSIKGKTYAESSNSITKRSKAVQKYSTLFTCTRICPYAPSTNNLTRRDSDSCWPRPPSLFYFCTVDAAFNITRVVLYIICIQLLPHGPPEYPKVNVDNPLYLYGLVILAVIFSIVPCHESRQNVSSPINFVYSGGP